MARLEFKPSLCLISLSVWPLEHNRLTTGRRPDVRSFDPFSKWLSNLGQACCRPSVFLFINACLIAQAVAFHKPAHGLCGPFSLHACHQFPGTGDMLDRGSAAPPEQQMWAWLCVSHVVFGSSLRWWLKCPRGIRERSFLGVCWGAIGRVMGRKKVYKCGFCKPCKNSVTKKKKKLFLMSLYVSHRNAVPWEWLGGWLSCILKDLMCGSRCTIFSCPAKGEPDRPRLHAIYLTGPVTQSPWTNEGQGIRREGCSTKPGKL